MRLRVKRRATLESLEDSADPLRPREFAHPAPNPEAALGDREMSERLRAEVRRLPPLLREILVLRDLEELSTDEVAQRIGISASAAKSRLMRARALLRERMERHASQKSVSVT